MKLSPDSLVFVHVSDETLSARVVNSVIETEKEPIQLDFPTFRRLYSVVFTLHFLSSLLLILVTDRLVDLVPHPSWKTLSRSG